MGIAVANRCGKEGITRSPRAQDRSYSGMSGMASVELILFCNLTRELSGELVNELRSSASRERHRYRGIIYRNTLTEPVTKKLDR